MAKKRRPSSFEEAVALLIAQGVDPGEAVQRAQRFYGPTITGKGSRTFKGASFETTEGVPDPLRGSDRRSNQKYVAARDRRARVGAGYNRLQADRTFLNEQLEKIRGPIRKTGKKLYKSGGSGGSPVFGAEKTKGLFNRVKRSAGLSLMRNPLSAAAGMGFAAYEIGTPLITGALADMGVERAQRLTDGGMSYRDRINAQADVVRSQQWQAQRMRRLEELKNQNMQMIAQSNPQLYSELLAGRRLPPRATVVGGRRRDDLMDELTEGLAMTQMQEAGF